MIKISEFSYKYSKYGWEVLHKGIIVAGLSVNVNLVTKEHNYKHLEYHRQCAQKALKEIIDKMK